MKESRQVNEKIRPQGNILWLTDRVIPAVGERIRNTIRPGNQDMASGLRGAVRVLPLRVRVQIRKTARLIQPR